MTALERIARRVGVDPRAVLGLVVIVCGTFVWALTFTGAIPKLFQGSSTTVRADFASAQDIVTNDPVRIDGVTVGHVGGVKLDPGARGATVELQLDSTAPPIHNDASASIRWRTALGANEAVTLDPGTAATGLLGSRTIPQTRTSDQVELDEITRTLHASARQGVRTTLQQLGPAFANQLAPAAAFNTLARVAPTVAVGIGAVRGLHPDSDLENLVDQAGQAARALDVGSGAGGTRQFVQASATTLTAIGASASDVRATIADAAVALPDITHTTALVLHTADLLDPLIARLIPTAPSVAPTLADLHPALADTNTLLIDATPLLRSLRPTVRSLAATARAGAPVIDQLAPSLKRIAGEILPALDKVSPESKHTVYEMIGPTLASTASVAGGYTKDGYFARLLASASANAVDFSPCRVNFQSSTQILTCESLLAALQQLVTPKANVIGPVAVTLAKASPSLAKALFKAVPSLVSGNGSGK